MVFKRPIPDPTGPGQESVWTIPARRDSNPCASAC